MANSKKRKNNTKKKTNNKQVVKEEKNIKVNGPFMTFMTKKWVRVTLHVITAAIWIFFLSDFLTFKQLGTFPNPILSILALVTLVLEGSVSKALKSK